MLKQLPPEFLKRISDNAVLAKMHLDLINIHQKLIAIVEEMKSTRKGDKGDTPTQQELLDLIVPIVQGIGAQLQAELPTLEDVKTMIEPLIPEAPEVPKLPSIDEIVLALKPHIPEPKHGKTPTINLDLLAEKIKGKIKLKPSKVEITHEMVLGALKGKKLKADMIDGLEKVSEIHFDTLLRRRGLPHGGGDTVKAGSNITLTRNGDGTVSIASSSGGFSTLSATETPDGNITVFTFSSATAQPTFILSDNVLMRATTKSGVTNWTWNAGLKQATLTIPPTEDVLAVV